MVVSPISLKPLNLVNKHVNELGVAPFCSQAFRLDHSWSEHRDCSLQRAPARRAPFNCADHGPPETGIISVCCVKVLTLWEFFNAAIDYKYTCSVGKGHHSKETS